MIGDVLLGLFMLAVGWVCLNHAFYHRRKGDPELSVRSSRRPEPEERPLKLIPLALGTLFVLIGVKLLAWALLELLRQYFTDLPRPTG